MSISTASAEPDTSRDDARYAAIAVRDRTQDGVWYYAVRTTGVYCRPGCGARLAKRAHVTFHDTRASAVAAGYRPCKRCHPERDLAP
jgi:AraC family transcriptional regulator of adaptative response/methylated-DNA-[protein]-cysteine methyltransferase